VLVTRLLVLASTLVPVPTAPVFGGSGSSDQRPPPVVLQGGRSVTTQSTSGQVQRFTDIPSTSEFGRYSASGARTCSFTAENDDTRLSNGDRVPIGTVVTSNYLFVEEPRPAAVDEPTPITRFDLAAIKALIPSLGPLDIASRRFAVWCDSSRYTANFVSVIDVPAIDVTLDPWPRLDHLLNTLQLERPTIFTNPVVDTYGGLVTRYSAWLAIAPDAWRTQQSPSENYRGTTILLIAQPRELDFIVDFVPNPDKPSPAYRGTIACVDATTELSSDGTAFPSLPVLPDQTVPGPNGPCMWTPPGPGRVTITARITYTIQFWADGYTEVQDDYTWTSVATTFDTGELIAVNTKPT
jgi:hypothetical protein